MTDIITTPKANIIIDATNYDLFELCHQRYNYRVNLRRSLPIIQKNRSLDIGGLAHKGFEAYYKALQQEIKFDDRIEKMALAIRAAASDPEESNVEVAEAEGLIRIIHQNLDYWRHEDETLIIHEVESPFAYVLFEDDDIRIVMTGKIDLLVDKPGFAGQSSYTNLPIDHKTYSRDSIVPELSNQFQNYVAATSSNYLIVNRVGLQKTLKPEEKFKRLPLSYSPGMIQQWKDNVIKVMLEHYCACVGSGNWPMNYTSCLKFNRLCEYYEVCKTDGEDTKKWKLEQNYVDIDPFDVTREMGD